jgi:hypothetical protein
VKRAYCQLGNTAERKRSTLARINSQPTATKEVQTCDLQHVNTQLKPHGQVPPQAERRRSLFFPVPHNNKKRTRLRVFLPAPHNGFGSSGPRLQVSSEGSKISTVPTQCSGKYSLCQRSLTAEFPPKHKKQIAIKMKKAQSERENQCTRTAWFFGLLLYAHRRRRISGTAGHIIQTPANQLMVMNLKIWSLSNPGFEPATFQSLTQRAYQQR